MKRKETEKLIPLAMQAAEETAENSIVSSEPLLDEQSAESSDGSRSEEAAGGKRPQTKEERSRYADADRKKTIEMMRKREGEIEALIGSLGVSGENLDVRIANAQEVIMQNKRQQFEADVQREADNTGVAPDIIRKAMLMDELQQQLHTLQWNQKTTLATDYCHAKDPCFFADLSAQDVSRLVVMIRAGFTPQQIYKTFAKEQDKGEPGISHIKAVGSARQSGAVDVPGDVLKEYERYGISHAEALSDYRKQMMSRY